MTMGKVYLVGGFRTPIGKTGGCLKNFLPEQLASIVLNELLQCYNLQDEDIDRVILGNAVGTGGNLARLAVLEAGWSASVPAVTVDNQCGSGLLSVDVGSSLILSGQADLVVVGGTESTSMQPKRQFNVSDPRFMGTDSFYSEAPFLPQSTKSVGVVAERLASKLAISRTAMDEWALQSHEKAVWACKENILSSIIAGIVDGQRVIDYDECIKERMSMRLLERMPSVFAEKGVLTAGNACLKHDGAAVVLLASEKGLERYGLKAEATVAGSSIAGCEPLDFFLSPVPSIERLLQKASVGISEIDFVEINEAFAVKVLACSELLGLPLAKVNVLGGALAYGHPYGASGGVILLHLLRSLQVFDKGIGIASIGAVGGIGTAVLLERC